VRGKEKPTLFGSLERVNHNHWKILPEGPKRVCVFLPCLEEGSSLRNGFLMLEYWKINRVQKSTDSE
jgi:hypothetical protein